MFIGRQKTIVTALVVVAAVYVFAALMFAGAAGEGAMKLEGAWIAKVVSYQDKPGLFPFQWSYVLAPDPSGRSATIHGSIDVGFPQNPLLPFDFHSPFIGEMVQTGPENAVFNTYWYEIRNGPTNEIVAIGRSWGEAKFVEPGKAEAIHHFEFYLPSTDTNGDGIPEGSPIAQFTVTTTDTRIPPPVR